MATSPALTCVLLTLLTAAASAADLKLGDKGVVASVTGMGSYTISYPVLQPGDLKPVQRSVNGNRTELTYAGDIGLSVELSERKVTITFRNVPTTVERFQLSTQIGPEFSDGGTWFVNANPPKPFPATKPEKPFLHQGNAASFTFADAAGRSLTIAGLPDFAFQQLQDNREWGWKIFGWHTWIPYNRDWKTFSFTVSQKVPTEIKAQVDRFGQTTRKDFPGKIAAEADLKADVASEAAYYASLKPMPTDAFGGLPGSKEKLGLEATGFFRVEKRGERWLLVNPLGNATFHLGICTFGYAPGEDATDVSERRDLYEWLPPRDGEFATAWHPESWWNDKAFSFYAANLIRKYGPDHDKVTHLTAVIERVKAMGFNAIGAFSGHSPAFTATHFPRVEHVGVGPALPGVRGVPDPFDADTLRRMDESWSKSLPPKANDPLIVGYFFANEQGLEDIPRAIPQLPGKHAAKQKLIETLRAKYATIADFNAAWNLDAENFEALLDRGLPVATKAAFADMQAYTELFLDAYHAAITSTFRKYNKNHLMIGNRWQPGTANSEMLCRIAGKYMDVISINYYTLAVDKAFVERLYRWTGGKPQMWTEFYYTSGTESNASASGLDMATQRERGMAYRHYVEHAASLDFVVGIEWFTLVDQAVTGRWFERTTGERNNTGIFNVADRPYRDLVEQMALTNRDVYGVWLDGKPPFVLDDPRFTGGASKMTRKVQAGKVAQGSIVIDGNADGWPGRPPERIGSDRVVTGKDGAGLEAAFKVCWDEANLYLLANVTDPTPMNNRNAGERLWQGDGLELFIGSEELNQSGTLLFSDRQILLGAKATSGAESTHVVNAPAQPSIPVAVVASVDGSGYTMEAAIPWSVIGVTPKDGTELIFDVAVDDAPEGGSRTRQLMWNGGAKNSADRSYWGRLTLVP